MNAPSLMIFAGALLIAGFSPGPAVAALVAHVIGRGLAGATLLTAGLSTYSLVAAYARTLLRNAHASRLLNRVGGATMAGAAVTVASR